ncbi:hypothetical protein GCM10023322_23280 [Rugosimonospora acidiphila]|uniref:Uncharacterized protein n=1 Tax=Rugosimonospora acidiphila TaxID=556531 RepID=A0ABP9RRI5_9ACTN
MGRGIGFRELLMVAVLATAGLLLAAVAVLSPWYAAPPSTRTPIVTVIHPGGVADRR